MFSCNQPLLEQAYSPMTVRFFTLQAHYRSEVDFSNASLQAAEKGYHRLMNAVDALASLTWKAATVDSELEKSVEQWLKSLYTEMSDDFNTAKVLAVLFELTSKINAMKASKMATGALSEALFIKLQQTVAVFVADVLGLVGEESGSDDTMDGVMNILIGMRADARANKDFATSDRIRDELAAAGIQLLDGKEGTGWSKF
jgi:cysteinyl-tRNA synthetase